MPTGLRSRLAGARRGGRAVRPLAVWYLQGCPVPPPSEYKRVVLRRYLRAYGLSTFVETGTFIGATAEAMARHAASVVTIELSPDLAETARNRLARASNATVLQGDSAELLPTVVRDLQAPALFWLDGHYSAGVTAHGSAETPVREELQAVLGKGIDGHVILIDDARIFVGGAYPSLGEIESTVSALAPHYRVLVRHDIIRLVPPR